MAIKRADEIKMISENKGGEPVSVDTVKQPKKDTGKTKSFSISLSTEMIERVKKYRFENEVHSISAVIQHALEAYLPKE